MKNKLLITLLLLLLAFFFQFFIRTTQAQSFSQLSFYFTGVGFLLFDGVLALIATIVAHQQYKSVPHKRVGFLRIYLSSLAMYILTAFGVQLFLELQVFNNRFSLYRYFADFFIRCVYHAIIAGTYIIIRLKNDQHLLRENLLKAQKALTESKLQLLQQQMNPHFLFNNLNVLSSLIDVNNTTAKDYIQHLAKIYRYLISSKRSEVVPLQDERDYIETYIYLLKKRFSGAYHFGVYDHTVTKNKMLPTLSLQELLINAMKHNRTDDINPLNITVSFYDEVVIVQNDLRSRFPAAASSGFGLKHLMERYRLFTDEEVVIIREKDQFIVKLPTLQAVDEKTPRK